MAKRNSRHKLLAPSFVVIAGAGAPLSCGLAGGSDGPEISYNPPLPTSSATCPTAQPASGSPCAADQLKCSYGSSCGASYATCSGGAWQVSMTTCNPPFPSCPSEVPAAGEPCEGQIACTYSTAECGQVTVTCASPRWIVPEPACDPECPEELPLDASACSRARLCVYGACGSDDPPKIAACDAVSWTVSEASCPPGGAAGQGGGAGEGAGGAAGGARGGEGGAPLE